MAISITLRKDSCLGNGTTTTFNFKFKVLNKDDFTLILTDIEGNDTTLQLDTDYSIANIGNDDGVIVSYPLSSETPNLADGEKLTGYRSTDITQLLDFQYGGGFSPRIHENAFDKVTMILQELAEELSRRPMLSITNADFNIETWLDDILKLISSKINGDGTGITDRLAFLSKLGLGTDGEIDLSDCCLTDGSNADADAFRSLVGIPKVESDVANLSSEITALSLATLQTSSSSSLIQDFKSLLGIEASVPSGTVSYYVADTPPDGWLVADGSEINRTDYADLFSAIGTTYGEGDSSTTFNIPDLRGVFIRGLDSGKGYDTNRILGSYQNDDNKAHTHTVSSYQFNNVGLYAPRAVNVVSYAGTFSTNSSGSTEARPKNVALLPCIKY